MRGRRERVLLAATVLAVGLAASLPASAQSADETTTTTSSAPTTTSSPPITLLPTTTTSPGEEPPSSSTTTTSPVRRSTTTTTVAGRPTTTTVPSSVITLPATTTTTELDEPAGPVELPTTTSVAAHPGKVDNGISVGWIVLAAVSALLLTALLLSVFTYRYWRSTAPAGPSPGVP